MPEAFLRCIKQGGKVVTRQVGKNKYIRLCKDKSGKWHQGEVHKKKK